MVSRAPRAVSVEAVCHHLCEGDREEEQVTLPAPALLPPLGFVLPSLQAVVPPTPLPQLRRRSGIMAGLFGYHP